MPAKFALFGYVENKEQVHMKYNILKKSPIFVKDWYIKKFNPYEIEEIDMGFADGFFVKLPMTEEETRAFPEEAEILTERILFDLKNMGVEIILPPKNINFAFPDIIRFAGNNKLLLFFINSIIKKACKTMKKDIKNVEILIMDGDTDKVFTLLDLIYPNINYLSIISEHSENPYYQEKLREIFEDNGLIICIKEKNRNLIETADIIINTSNDINKWSYYYKKDAIFIDISDNIDNYLELVNRRPDMVVSNTVKVNFNGNKIFLDLFETYFYAYSKKYQNFLKRGYNPRLVAEIEEEINRFDFGMPLLTFQNP